MICIRMIEPVSASIAVYLISRGTSRIDKHKRIMNKNPLLIKKKICKWILRNREEVINSVIDETNDYMMDTLNLIHISYYNPSILMMIYMLLLIITIII